MEHHLGLGLALHGLELNYIAAVGPTGGPERTVGSEREALGPDVAVGREVLLRGVEHLDTGAGGNEDEPSAGLDGESEGDRISELVDDLSGRRVKLEERAAAAAGPKPALGVHR